MESKSTIIIEENFKTTKNLESLFATMNKISDIQKKILNIIQGYKDDIAKILSQENLENISRFHYQIQKTIDACGTQFTELFGYDQIEENLAFVKSKLEERRRALLSKISSVPLDEISNVEIFLSGYNQTEIVQGDRTFKVPLDTPLGDILRNHQDHQGLCVRLLNGLRSRGIKTVGDLMVVRDGKESISIHDLLKNRNIGKKTMQFLGTMMKDVVFGKYTQEDAVKIQQLLQATK